MQPTVEVLRLTTARLAVWFLLGVLLYVLFVCAWQCDDAYITFRTVRNFWEGHGLTWNPDERVQTYTHPLWMMFGLVAYGLCRELFFSMTAVSIVLSLGSALLLALTARSRRELSLTLLVLVSSCAFVDFSVSGLENPLLHVLLASAVLAGCTQPSERSDLLFGLATSGVFLTRMDATLLVLPVWLVRWRRPGRPSRAALLGLLPCAAWEAYSLIYYGALVPNTALAKLNVAIAPARLALEGAHYFRDSLARDPLTLVASMLAMLVAGVWGRRYERALALGVCAYLIYIVRIGGDFMSGRFFTAPLVVAVAAANLALRERTPTDVARYLSAALATGLVVYGLLWPRAPIHASLGFGDARHHADIADERAFYYPYTGLLPVLVYYHDLQALGLPIPPLPNALRGQAYARTTDGSIVASENVGALGYNAGDKIVIDSVALADPLLARIVYQPPAEGFRVGHYQRALPAGYIESRYRHHNLIRTPALRAAYDAILLVVRGPLFDGERWRAIWRLHSGYYAAAFRAPYAVQGEH